MEMETRSSSDGGGAGNVEDSTLNRPSGPSYDSIRLSNIGPVRKTFHIPGYVTVNTWSADNRWKSVTSAEGVETFSFQPAAATNWARYLSMFDSAKILSATFKIWHVPGANLYMTSNDHHILTTKAFKIMMVVDSDGGTQPSGGVDGFMSRTNAFIGYANEENTMSFVPTIAQNGILLQKQLIDLNVIGNTTHYGVVVRYTVQSEDGFSPRVPVTFNYIMSFEAEFHGVR